MENEIIEVVDIKDAFRRKWERKNKLRRIKIDKKEKQRRKNEQK
jgi:hypothetical protein